MSIFRRSDPASSPSSSSAGPGDPSSSPAHSSSSAAQRRRVTHIAPGTRVEGLLSGTTELLIEGEVVGEIRVQAPVVIGTDGVVQGPIAANTVRIGGRVAGNIQATERVEVAPSGSLEGDIAAPRVIIAEGAFFKGLVEMRADRGEEKPAERPEPKAERPEPKAERPNEARRSKGNAPVPPS
jgi:cytoskeletal protein CcmA (bactofilin family)